MASSARSVSRDASRAARRACFSLETARSYAARAAVTAGASPCEVCHRASRQARNFAVPVLFFPPGAVSTRPGRVRRRITQRGPCRNRAAGHRFQGLVQRSAVLPGRRDQQVHRVQRAVDPHRRPAGARARVEDAGCRVCQRVEQVGQRRLQRIIAHAPVNEYRSTRARQLVAPVPRTRTFIADRR